MVTAGFKWAPEMGPNVRINARRAAAVATVLASRAMALLPPDSRSDHLRPHNRRQQKGRADQFGRESTREIGSHRSRFRMTIADAGQADGKFDHRRTEAGTSSRAICSNPTFWREALGRRRQEEHVLAPRPAASRSAASVN